MIPPGQLTGAVLAGGQSRRMGRDKAGLLVEGEPLWRRQVRVLREAGAIVAGVVRRSEQAALGLPAGVSLWCDTVAGAGPLAGLQAALAASPTEFVAVLATDMPRIDAAWFRHLAGGCSPGVGAIARHLDGTFEPLAAIYPRTAHAAVTRSLRAGRLTLQALARELVVAEMLVVVPLPAGEAWRAASWNLPADAAPGP